jgi:DNA-binding CsgD family transcriptional regulator
MIERQVLIVSSDTLMGLGLRTLLHEQFGIAASYISTWDGESSMKALRKQYTLVFCDETAMPGMLAQATRSQLRRIIPFAGAAPAHPNGPALPVNCSPETLIASIEEILSRLRVDTKPGASSLTHRETEVLKLLASGYIIKEIGDLLRMSAHTALSHRRNISTKLGIKTVPGLTVYAMIHGLISSEEIL